MVAACRSRRLDRTAEHYDAVLREFHLVLEREPAARAAVPGRLIALMDELTLFGPLISSVEQDLEHGRRSGAETLDVSLELPREIGPVRSPSRQPARRDRRLLRCRGRAALPRTGERGGGAPEVAHRGAGSPVRGPSCPSRGRESPWATHSSEQHQHPKDRGPATPEGASALRRTAARGARATRPPPLLRQDRGTRASPTRATPRRSQVPGAGAG